MRSPPPTMAAFREAQALLRTAAVPTTDRHAYVSYDHAVDLLVGQGCTVEEAKEILDDAKQAAS